MTDDPVWSEVRDFGALRAAARRAARGARAPAARAFLCELEGEVLALQRALDADAWTPGPMRTFRIRDPKPRTISAAPFRDRVVHHSLCAAVEPLLDAKAVPMSYACRKGLGTTAALRALRAHARRYDRFLKLDVRKYFESVDHEVLEALLLDRLGPGRPLELCRRVIAAGGAAPGRGLPIGSLTSQHFANLALEPLDHFIVDTLQPGAYARYMDDLLLLDDDRGLLRRARVGIEGYARDHLRLTLRPEITRLAPTRDGILFLGFRVFPGTVRMDRSRARRLGRRLRALRSGLAAGSISEADAARRAESACAWAAQGDTVGLRRSILDSASAKATIP